MRIFQHCLIQLVLFSVLFPFQTTQATPAGELPITITLPAPALHRTISDMLPLPIEQSGDSLQGIVTLDSISKLAINDNLISLQGQVSGTDMQLTTSIGGQDIKLKFGKLVLPVTCDISMRYDQANKTLFLTPVFHNPSHGNSSSTKTLLPLLNALGNREYPVSMDQINPIRTEIGRQAVTVRFEPVDIRAANNEMIIKFRPIAGKSN